MKITEKTRFFVRGIVKSDDQQIPASFCTEIFCTIADAVKADTERKVLYNANRMRITDVRNNLRAKSNKAFDVTSLTLPEIMTYCRDFQIDLQKFAGNLEAVLPEIEKRVKESSEGITHQLVDITTIEDKIILKSVPKDFTKKGLATAIEDAAVLESIEE